MHDNISGKESIGRNLIEGLLTMVLCQWFRWALECDHQLAERNFEMEHGFLASTL